MISPHPSLFALWNRAFKLRPEHCINDSNALNMTLARRCVTHRCHLRCVGFQMRAGAWLFPTPESPPASSAERKTVLSGPSSDKTSTKSRRSEIHRHKLTERCLFTLSTTGLDGGKKIFQFWRHFRYQGGRHSSSLNSGRVGVPQKEILPSAAWKIKQQSHSVYHLAKR